MNKKSENSETRKANVKELIKHVKISWCATCSKDDLGRLQETIKSIKNQTIKPYEIIVTTGGNIAQGRNEYLMKACGNVIASFDGGCIYEKDYSEKMIQKLLDDNADIAMAHVKPVKPKNRIQKFLVNRLPEYNKFSEDDWNNFVPSNRQVMFFRNLIIDIGLIPQVLWRADDTYWFKLARDKGIKFTHSDAKVYWEMKRTLKSYLWAVYNDNKVDKQFNIKPFSAKHKKIELTAYGVSVSALALISKCAGRCVGYLNPMFIEDFDGKRISA